MRLASLYRIDNTTYPGTILGCGLYGSVALPHRSLPFLFYSWGLIRVRLNCLLFIAHLLV